MIKKKNLVLGFLFMLAFSFVNGQETKTVINHFKPFKKVNTLGLYVAPEIQYGVMAGSFTPIGGLTGMLQVNNKWGIGVSGFSTLKDFAPKQLSPTKAYRFDAQYGGLNLEYTPKPEGVVHVSFPLLLGAGMSNIGSALEMNDMHDGNNDMENHLNNDGHEKDNAFAIIQPGINLESNLFKYGKVFIGAKYRLAMGKSGMVDLTNPMPVTTASQLNGFSINAGLKIGLFNYSIRKAKKD
jgi:hypothetical protein